MANIFVGFHDRKSCSRILKPPGGGTSDIFNTSIEDQTNNTDNKTSKTVVKKESIVENTTINGNEHKQDNEIQVKNGKLEENENEIKPEDVKIETLIISESSNETTNVDEKDGNVEVKTIKSAQINSSTSKTESLSSIVHSSQHVEVKTNATERRSSNRVPPGGYSSGLW